MKRILLAFLFGSALCANAVPVTFQVNMSVQTTVGNFDPALHAIEVHGSFDGWAGGAVLSASPEAGVYSADVEVGGAAGTAVQYKFVINQSGTQVWEVDGVGPAGAQNRSFNLENSAQTLPVVFFNNQTTPPGVVAVTFQINMGVQKSLGNFDPALHTVEVHGAFDGWGPGVSLTVSPTDGNLYQGTANITGASGAVVEHKFVINQAGTQVWEGNVGPGGPFGNRTFTLAASPQTLPTVYFNNLSSDPGKGIPVTFKVTLGVPVGRGTFDPAASTVYVAGAFNNWNATASVLTNTVAEPYVYIGTIDIKTVAPGGSVPYKFVMNGTAWETGDNRAFILAANAQTLPFDYWDRVDSFGPIAISAVINSFQVDTTLSWNGGPLVRLQSAPDLTSPWVDVPDSLGQATMTFTFDPASGEPNRLFRLVGP
jgi:hypothetical protein